MRSGTGIALHSREEFWYCQGARCGHIDGKARVGSYVAGEEFPLSFEASAINTPDHGWRYDVWAEGYRVGYRLGAEGECLPAEIESAPLL